MTEQFANFAQSTLTSQIGAAQTTITVANASSFPLLGNFRIVVQSFDPTTNLAVSAPELMIVTAVSGNQFTVTRGAESTKAIAFASGAKVTHIVTAAVLAGFGAGGVTNLQGETGAITLTSNGSTVAITTPTSSSINFESIGSTINTNAYSILGNTTNATAGAASIQYPVLGVPGYVTTGINYAQFTIASNNFAQMSLQNSSNGASASSDFVATADTGNDATNYADFGINNSAGAAAPFTTALAAYLYTVTAELDIGALSAGGVVKVYTTGGTTPVLAATFTATQGLTVVGAIAGSNLSGTNTGDQTITLTGDVTGSGTGSFAATIANSAVTYAKMQNATQAALVGASAAGVLGEITLGTNLSFSSGVLNATSGGNTNFFYGSGQDGTVTISSGTTTLTRDMYYANLTISGTGILKPNGFRIFVSGTLDISAAPAGAIIYTGNAGNNAAGATGGVSASLTVGTNNTIVQQGSAGAGGNGTTTTGTPGAGGTGVAWNVLANSQSGAAGAGTPGAAGGGAGPITPSQYSYPYKYNDTLPKVAMGTPGCGGGGGGGDAVNAGGGGGGAGLAGGTMVICASVIARGSSVISGIISAIGGKGGNGAAGVAGNTGGGGGGSGGQGGNILIFFGSRTGSAITNAIDVTGGAGGNGGALVGTGANGNGGGGGAGGYVLLTDLTLNTLTEYKGNAATARQTGGVTAGVAATTSQTNI